jgi:hypothetical protein
MFLNSTPLGGMVTVMLAVFVAMIVALMILLVADNASWALMAAPVALLVSVGALQRL